MSLNKILGLVAALTVTSLAQADTLLIDGLEMSEQTQPSRPGRGMKMERVESAFGAPTSRVAAIGEPPIARWEYPGFTVYFEHDTVLHTVARRQ